MKSDAERYLDYMYDCITDINGEKLCKNQQDLEDERRDDTDWMQFLTDVKLPMSENPVPKGAKRACSGSCLNPEDCDIGSDCLCASTRGM